MNNILKHPEFPDMLIKITEELKEVTGSNHVILLLDLGEEDNDKDNDKKHEKELAELKCRIEENSRRAEMMKEIRKRLGISIEYESELLGITKASLKAYESREKTIPEDVYETLLSLADRNCYME